MFKIVFCLGEEFVSSLGITTPSNVKKTTLLRQLVVEEWRQYEDKYSLFVNNGSYIDEVNSFATDGYFDYELGNSLPLAMANVLKIPIVVLTGMQNMPLITLCPDNTIISPVEIWLVFDHANGGFYDFLYPKKVDDLVVENTLMVNLETKIVIDKGCRCGNGAKRKQKELVSCNAYRTGCPCFRTVKGCTVCC